MSNKLNFTVRTVWELADAIENVGFLPLFRNFIPGFSVEEHVAPSAWLSDDPGVWDRRDAVTRYGNAHQQDKQKSRFIVSGSIYNNVYIITEKSM